MYIPVIKALTFPRASVLPPPTLPRTCMPMQVVWLCCTLSGSRISTRSVMGDSPSSMRGTPTTTSSVRLQRCVYCDMCMSVCAMCEWQMCVLYVRTYVCGWLRVLLCLCISEYVDLCALCVHVCSRVHVCVCVSLYVRTYVYSAWQHSILWNGLNCCKEQSLLLLHCVSICVCGLMRRYQGCVTTALSTPTSPQKAYRRA